MFPTPGHWARTGILAATLALATNLSASAQDAEPQTQGPDFSSIPKAPKALEMVPPVFPKAAETAQKDGRATIIFDITDAGKVINARIGQEAPTGLGFGDAAIASISQWTYPAGQAGTYRVRLKFDLPDNDAAAAMPVDMAHVVPAPEPTVRVAPVYPPDMLGQGKEGAVRLVFRINPNGTIPDAAVMEEGTTDMAFARAAHDAVIRWQYAQPYWNKSYVVDIVFNRDAIARGLVERPD